MLLTLLYNEKLLELERAVDRDNVYVRTLH